MIDIDAIKSHVHYNPETGLFTRLKNPANTKAFNSRYGNKIAGWKRPNGYIMLSINGEQYRAHRVAWYYVYGEIPEQIDHINGVRDDNRICNLRSVSNKENGKNQKLRSTNKTGITGVVWHKAAGKWHSQITVNGININLGLNVDFFEACCARKSAERMYGFHLNHGRS